MNFKFNLKNGKVFGVKAIIKKTLNNRYGRRLDFWRAQVYNKAIKIFFGGRVVRNLFILSGELPRTSSLLFVLRGISLPQFLNVRECGKREPSRGSLFSCLAR